MEPHYRPFWDGLGRAGVVILPLAQIEGIATPTTIVGAFIAVTLGAMALLGWVLKHLFITTIPGIQAEQKQQREANQTALVSIIAAYQAETGAERALCEKQSGLLNTTIAALTTAIGQEGRSVIAAINEHTTEQVAAYRHDLNNTINNAVLGKELYLAQKMAEQRANGGNGNDATQ